MPQTVIRVFRAADKTVPLAEWLETLKAHKRKAYPKCRQRILLLSKLGSELRRPLADILRDGIRELRVRDGRVHYRMLYFFHGANVVCLSHGLTKEGAVADAEIDLAVTRKKLVERDPEKYTAAWEV